MLDQIMNRFKINVHIKSRNTGLLGNTTTHELGSSLQFACGWGHNRGLSEALIQAECPQP